MKLCDVKLQIERGICDETLQSWLCEISHECVHKILLFEQEESQKERKKRWKYFNVSIRKQSERGASKEREIFKERRRGARRKISGDQKSGKGARGREKARSRTENERKGRKTELKRNASFEMWEKKKNNKIRERGLKKQRSIAL